jgi:hypothetical protein
MDVREAVAAAKKYVAEIFESEGIRHLGLEEVIFDEQLNQWRVTVGFSRPWESGAFGPGRTFKVVHVWNNSGEVRAVESREPKA